MTETIAPGKLAAVFQLLQAGDSILRVVEAVSLPC